METYSSTHDLFLYLDSDAVISNHNLSIYNFLSNISWVPTSICEEFTVNACHAALPYDTWLKSDTYVLPNSGVIFFRPTLEFRQFVQLWWHFNMHESNMAGWYEQDVLWNILQDLPSQAAPRPSKKQLADREAWNTKVKIIIEDLNLVTRLGIFNHATFGYKHQSQFILHMTSNVGQSNRVPQLTQLWRRERGTLNRAKLLAEISRKYLVSFDTTLDRIPSRILASNFSLAA
ncbi:unnamed protein product [Rotaria sp. Silwood1]|nr:unnamed protein product [Rotaria sp. Silwood1]